MVLAHVLVRPATSKQKITLVRLLKGDRDDRVAQDELSEPGSLAGKTRDMYWNRETPRLVYFICLLPEGSIWEASLLHPIAIHIHLCRDGCP